MTPPPVLVAFESRFGATAEVARVVGEELAARGHAVSVRRTSEVLDPTPYGAVIVGAPVYSRRWLESASAWVRAHGESLRGRPLWFFALGIRVPDGPHANERHTVRLLRRLHHLVPGIEPRRIGLFAGRVNPAIVGLREQLQLRVFRPRTGDFRDWDKIRDWSRGVAEELGSAAPASARSVSTR
ncbi:MAG: flavodoxin [Deltaproteobacteria bacterium]|nr:flavodoxin [Deltaproteobacteria bacterium]